MIGEGNNWCAVVVLLWILNINVEAGIIATPADTEVLVGESTYLNCSIPEASDNINWHHYPVGKGFNDLRYVYTGGQMFAPYNERFRIEKGSSNGGYNLVITDAEVQDAGKYVCQNGGGSATAELIVLETLPMCMSNFDSSGIIGPNSCRLKNESIQLSCGVNYDGNVPPGLQWKRITPDGSFPIPESCSVSDGRITCNYTTEANMEMDGSAFRCQTRRSRNTQYNCETADVKLLYLVENKTRIAKTVDSVVTCSAKTSSADCNYKWIWYDGDHQETVSENSRLVIVREGLHRCEANCSIREFRCLSNIMTIKATVADDSSGKDTNKAVHFGCILGVIVAGFLCIIIVIIIVYFKWKVAYWRCKAEINRDATDKVLCEQSGELLPADSGEVVAKNVDPRTNNDENEGACAEWIPLAPCSYDQESENTDCGRQSRWMCQKCTFMNLEKNVFCTMCSAPKIHENFRTNKRASEEDDNKDMACC